MVDGLYERFELSKFVSSATIQSIKHSNKGTKTEIAIFFSDIRGFTAFSEKLSPEAVVTHLNKILNVQTEIIQRYGGDIDKYVGDEIVALFFGEGPGILRHGSWKTDNGWRIRAPSILTRSMVVTNTCWTLIASIRMSVSSKILPQDVSFTGDIFQ